MTKPAIHLHHPVRSNLSNGSEAIAAPTLIRQFCPLCGASDHFEIPDYSAILDLPGHTEARVMQCRRCDGLYLFPYISKAQLSALYGKAYFTGDSSDNQGLDVPASEEEFDSAFSALRKQKFRDTVAELKAMRPTARNILDIGAATGDFLAVARDAGLNTFGIELSDYAASQAKAKYGFDLHRVDVLDYQGVEKFDLIHLNHVFEHFIDPRAVADKLHRLTNPGGLVYVEVPFQFNIFERLKYRLRGWRQRFNVFSIHHPVFYRPKTLIKVLSESGFDCAQLRLFRWSRYPAEGFLAKAKRLLWSIAALFGQGIQMEAVFVRR